ncbi:MAG: hypothetical protein PHE89_01965 [Alphaproteobacteria bacterium]|nr:hypothetical protein [Alphaproteobacteria bacterium]
MFENIKTTINNIQISEVFANAIENLGSLLQNFDTSNNSVRLLSLILISITFCLFIIMTLFIYIKSIISLIKDDNYQESTEKSFKEEEEKKEEESLLQKKEEEDRLVREKDAEQEKEKLTLEKKEQEDFRQREEKKFLEQTQKETEDKQKKEALEKEKTQKEEKQKEKKEQALDLDWQKGKKVSFENLSTEFPADYLQYKQNKKELGDLIGLIIDMLSRGVTNLKIAQTIMFRSQGEVAEEQVLQVIAAIDEFVGLCNTGKFKKLIGKEGLPSERDALYHLAQGDNSLALLLLEGLMNDTVENANMMGTGSRREELLRDVSAQACVFGTLSSINDVHLATNSFELSIELNPANVVAWSRVGDMYSIVSSTNRAVWAYNKVIEMADEEINAEQVANANKALSEYYYDQGNSLQAAKMYNSAKLFYDSIGVNRNLDRQELDIIEIIESNQSENLNEAITKLLSNSRAA